MHYLIVGGCAAGLNAIEGIREEDQQGEITLVSAEPYLPYARCLITNYLAGTHSKKDLCLKDENYFRKNRVALLLGERVTRIIPGEKRVQTASGKQLRYDRLLVATGSLPRNLGVAGEQIEGIYHFWTLTDAQGILARAEKCKQAVIFGGGLIGLKAATALKKRGLKVQIIVKSHHLLSQLVNPEAAEIVADCLQANGLIIRTGLAPVEMLGEQELSGVKLDNGEKMETGLAIVGKGVFPNKELGKEAGTECRYGIVVDDFLQTGCPDVFAAGDVAETRDMITGESTVNGLWLTAQEQGRLAGLNMAGARRKYPGSFPANATEFFGLPLVSAGILRPEKSDEIREKQDRKSWNYQRFILRKNRLVGFVMVGGDPQQAGFYTAVIRAGIDLKNYKNFLGKSYFDYGYLREKLEKDTGFRESVSPEGQQIFFS
ncbi:MAG TPA: FAD-dependent oxidoreductase [bacterium]|nr:FAD-dependent oxidoreductase [bacterium]